MNICYSSASSSPLISKVFGAEQFRETLRELANTPEEIKVHALFLRVAKLGLGFKVDHTHSPAHTSTPTSDLLIYKFIQYGMKHQWLEPDDVILIQEIVKHTFEKTAKQNLEELATALATRYYKSFPKQKPPQDKAGDASEESKGSKYQSSDQGMKEEKEEKEKKGAAYEGGTFLQQEARQLLSQEAEQMHNGKELQQLLDPELFKWIFTVTFQQQSLDGSEKRLFVEKLFYAVKKTFFFLHVEEDEDGELTGRQSLKINPSHSEAQMCQIISLSIPFLIDADEDQSALSMQLLERSIDENSSKDLEAFIVALGSNVSDVQLRLDALKVVLAIVGKNSVNASNDLEYEAGLFKKLMRSPQDLIFLKKFTFLLENKRFFGNPGLLFKHLISSLESHYPTFLNFVLDRWLTFSKTETDELVAKINPSFCYAHDSQLIAMYIGVGYPVSEWADLISHLLPALETVPIVERLRRAELLMNSEGFQIDLQKERYSIAYSLLQHVFSYPQAIEEGISYLLTEPSGSSVVNEAPTPNLDLAHPERVLSFSKKEMAIPIEEWIQYLKKMIVLLKLMPESERITMIRVLITLLQDSAIEQRIQILHGLISIAEVVGSKAKTVSLGGVRRAPAKEEGVHLSFLFLLNLSGFLLKISSDQDRLKIIKLIAENKQRSITGKIFCEKWESAFEHWNHLFSVQIRELTQFLRSKFRDADISEESFQAWKKFINEEVEKNFAEEFIQFMESEQQEKKASEKKDLMPFPVDSFLASINALPAASAASSSMSPQAKRELESEPKVMSELKLLVDLYHQFVADLPISYSSSFSILLQSHLRTGKPISKLQRWMNGWRAFPLDLRNKLLSELEPLFSLNSDALLIAILKISSLYQPLVEIAHMDCAEAPDKTMAELIDLFIHQLSCVLIGIPKEYRFQSALICLELTANSERDYVRTMKSGQPLQTFSLVDKTFYKNINQVLSLFPPEKRCNILNQDMLLGEQNNLTHWIHALKGKYPALVPALDKIFSCQVEIAITNRLNPIEIKEVNAVAAVQSAEQLRAREALKSQIVSTFGEGSHGQKFMTDFLRVFDFNQLTNFDSIFWKNPDLSIPMKMKLMEFALLGDRITFFNSVFQLIRQFPSPKLEKFFTQLFQLVDMMKEKNFTAMDVNASLCMLLANYSVDQVEKIISSWLKAKPRHKEKVLCLTETGINRAERLSCALLVHYYAQEVTNQESEPFVLFKVFEWFGKSLTLPIVFTLVKFIETAGDAETAYFMFLQCTNLQGISKEEVESIISSTLTLIEGCSQVDQFEEIMDMVSDITLQQRKTLISQAPLLLSGIKSDRERFALILHKNKGFPCRQNFPLGPHLIKWADYFDTSLKAFLLSSDVEMIKEIFISLKENSFSFFKNNYAYFRDKSQVTKMVEGIKDVPKEERLGIVNALIQTQKLGIDQAHSYLLNCPSSERSLIAQCILLLKENKERMKQLFDPLSQDLLAILIDQKSDAEKIVSFFAVINQEFISSYPSNPYLVNQIVFLWKHIETEDRLILIPHLATILGTRSREGVQAQLIKWNSIPNDYKKMVLDQLKIKFKRNAAPIAFELTEWIYSKKWELFSPCFLEASRLMGLKVDSWNLETSALIGKLAFVFINCTSESHAKAVLAALYSVPPERFKEFFDYMDQMPLSYFPNQHFLLLPMVHHCNQQPLIPMKNLLDAFMLELKASRESLKGSLEGYFNQETQEVLRLYFPSSILEVELFNNWKWYLQEAIDLLPPHVAISGELSAGEILILLFNQMNSTPQYVALTSLQLSFIAFSFNDKSGQEVLLQFLYSVFREKSFSEIALYAEEWGQISPTQQSRLISGLTPYFKEDPINVLSTAFELIVKRDKTVELDRLIEGFISALKTALETSGKVIKKEGSSSAHLLSSAKLVLVSELLEQFKETDQEKVLRKLVAFFKPEEKKEGADLLQKLVQGIDPDDLDDLFEALEQGKENLFQVIRATLNLRINDANPSQNVILINALSSIPLENMAIVEAFVKTEFPDITEGYPLSSVVKNICQIPLDCFNEALSLLRATPSPTPWLRTDVRESLLILLSKHQNGDLYYGMLNALFPLLKRSHNPSTVIEQMEQWDKLKTSLQTKASDALQLFKFFTKQNWWSVLLAMIYSDPSDEEWNKFIENFTEALVLTNAPEHYPFWILMFKKAKPAESKLVLSALTTLATKFNPEFNPEAWRFVLHHLINLPIYEDILDTGQRLRILQEILIALNHPRFQAVPGDVVSFLAHIASLVTEIRSGPMRADLIKELALHLPKGENKALMADCVTGLTLVPHNQRTGVVKDLIDLLAPINVPSEREAILFAIIDYVQINRAEAIKYVASLGNGFPQHQRALLLYALRGYFENLSNNRDMSRLQFITYLVSKFATKPEDAIFCRLIDPQVRVEALQRLDANLTIGRVIPELGHMIHYLFSKDESRYFSRQYMQRLIAEFTPFRFTPEYPEADYKLSLLIETYVISFGLQAALLNKVATTAILIRGRSTLETRTKGQNPYFVFKRLKDSQATEYVRPVNTTQVVHLGDNQTVFISLDSEMIRKIAQKEQLNFGLLPENYRQQSFIALLKAFNVRYNAVSKEGQQQIQGAIWHTCLGESNWQKACAQAAETERSTLIKMDPNISADELKGKIEAASKKVEKQYWRTSKAHLELSLTSNFLTELINAFGPPEAPIDNSKYYVHLILESIYQENDQLSIKANDPGSFLTPRERILFSLAWQLIECSTGQQDGLSQYYTHVLDPIYKNKANVEGAQVEGFVGATEKIDKCLKKIDIQQIIECVCKDAHFLKRLIGNAPREVFDQESHQTTWILNRLSKPLALNHRVAFDAHAEQIAACLINMPTQNLVSAVLENTPIQALMVMVQKGIAEGLEASGEIEKADAKTALESFKAKEKKAAAALVAQKGKEGEEDAKDNHFYAERAVKNAETILAQAPEKGRQKFYNALRDYLAKGVSKAEQEYNPQWDKKYCQIEYNPYGTVVTKPFSGLTELGALALLKSGGFISGWKIQ